MDGRGESQLGPCICSVATREVTWYAGVAKPGQRDPSITGLGSAGLRRLSRRGSWVRIPPPAPNQQSNHRFSFPSGFCLSPLWHTGTLQKLYEFIFRILFLSGWDSGLVFSRRVRYRLIQDFLIPVESPSDKRGNLCSQNRLLGIDIWADYRLILADKPEIRGLYPCSWLSDLLAGSAKVGYM